LEALRGPWNARGHRRTEGCKAKTLDHIMKFNCNWNEENFAQFYANLYTDLSTDTNRPCIGQPKGIHSRSLLKF
jgi:hypothetical protein